MNINNWFYLIDKPVWISSFDIIRKLRKITNIKKMWHTWTLDPLASGLVLLAFWNYTKLIPYFEKDIKEYEFKINLNWTTPTFDLEYSPELISDILQEKYKKELKIEEIKEILKNKFSWKIFQIPPKYSAIKIWWKKALDMARNWEEFEMKKREVIIYNIEIISYNYPELFLKALVSAWTYIRSIANDLWYIIWTWWYITHLKRIKIGNIDFSYSQQIDNFDINKKLDIEELFKNKKMFYIDDNNILKDINNWKVIENIFSLDDKEEIFIKNKDWDITNILICKNWQIYPERKI